MTKNTKATPDSDVILTELKNGETVLLHLGSQTYYGLNETGSRIWHLMNKGFTLGEIAKKIQVHFDVELNRAQNCVNDLAADLADAKLVSFVENPKGPKAKNHSRP